VLGALIVLSPVFALGVALIALPLMLLAILGGGVARLAVRRGLGRPASMVAVASVLAVQLVSAQWLLSPGGSNHEVEPTLPAAGVTSLNAPNPSVIGPYAVQTLTYGSGVDKRPEYGQEAT
jgi:hypothetical protein